MKLRSELSKLIIKDERLLIRTWLLNSPAQGGIYELFHVPFSAQRSNGPIHAELSDSWMYLVREKTRIDSIRGTPQTSRYKIKTMRFSLDFDHFLTWLLNSPAQGGVYEMFWVPNSAQRSGGPIHPELSDSWMHLGVGKNQDRFHFRNFMKGSIQNQNKKFSPLIPPVKRGRNQGKITQF